MIITLPKGTPFQTKECPFCHKAYLSIVIGGRTGGFDKVEGVTDGYRPHECDEMMQQLEQAFQMLAQGEK